MKVGAATRIDWTFTVGHPNRWLPKEYDSTKQHYELYVPPDYDPKKSYPVVFFMSPGSGPAGWHAWESVCKQHGVIFASAYNTPNSMLPGQMRFRIVLDVFDELRRNYNTDPDRTYICGFSGGGRIAARIAFALPEYFGGTVAVGSSGEFRNEDWLRHRLIDKLSVGMVTGDKDFNHGECVLYRNPWLQEIGVRSRVWDIPNLPHAIPGGDTMAEVFGWLEADLPRRRELAKKYPAIRMPGNAAPSADEWSRVMLAEAKQRLQEKATVYSGLALLQGVAFRWNGLPVAAEAAKLVVEWETKPEKPWDEDRHNDRRRYTRGRALGLTLWVTGYSPDDRAPNTLGTEPLNPRTMATEALQLWEQIIKEGKDAKGVEEANKRIPELRKILAAKE
ncbi:hypothetical protein AYO44_09840 [Planctomycetaceae bacterium SCGC AG-212-F19]|nr:hypothetical protein AYO44_09840 [Planctomycetaceae bacterium SCGC AG-212-F19]